MWRILAIILIVLTAVWYFNPKAKDNISFPQPIQTPELKNRVTKKPFGIFITKENSPIQPEKFTGYHTGIDFETFEDEKDSELQVKAVCSGKLLMKKWVSGYGGVVVQECTINQQLSTVVYGHLGLDSVDGKVGEIRGIGDVLGTLGKGFSIETDGERKHLHLGIHKGASIDIKGYVQSKGELDNWLDPQLLISSGTIHMPI